jgi:AcrR family transcriptional regulator
LKPKKHAKPAVPKRSRNAEATRDAILQSARRAFARAGYDGAGVREIAREAGVTAMMINRYFGSKEQLFADVLVEVMQTPTILAADNLRSANIAENFAAALVEITKVGETPLEGFLIMMYSAASQAAADIGREQIQNNYQKLLASVLRGEQREERAALVFALIAGVQVMRQIIALPALAAADPRKLTRLLKPLFEQLLGEPRSP